MKQIGRASNAAGEDEEILQKIDSLYDGISMLKNFVLLKWSKERYGDAESKVIA